MVRSMQHSHALAHAIKIFQLKHRRNYSQKVKMFKQWCSYSFEVGETQ